MMNDPVLNRAMFRPVVAPMSSYGTGIASNVASPDEAARALQTAFQPTGYAGGGQVINGVKHFQFGGLNKLGSSPPGPTDIPRFDPGDMAVSDGLSPSIPPVTGKEEEQGPAPKYVPKTPIMRYLYGLVEATPGRQAAFDKLQKEKETAAAIAQARAENRVPTIFEEVTDEDRAAAAAKQQAAVDEKRRAAGITTLPDTSRKAAAEAAARYDDGVSSSTAVPAADQAQKLPADKTGGEKKADEESGLGKRLSLRIDELKQEREANKAQRRENQLLALMQAGFQAAAGKSSSALANIAVGGASGIATLADLEKTRRAEDTALRKEALELELAKEKLAESAKERAAAREERSLSRDITGLKAVADANKGLIVSYENQILTLERLQDAPGISEEKKKEYGQLIAQKQIEINRLRLEQRQQAQGLLPKGMKSPNLDFQAEVRGSRPTQAGT